MHFEVKVWIYNREKFRNRQMFTTKGRTGGPWRVPVSVEGLKQILELLVRHGGQELLESIHTIKITNPDCREDD